MARLRKIIFHNLAFYGDLRKDRREGEPNTSHYKNTVAFASLPSLSELIFDGNNLVNFGMVRLESMCLIWFLLVAVPNVQDIIAQGSNFTKVYHLQDKGVYC